jgi:hypothetical protein
MSPCLSISLVTVAIQSVFIRGFVFGKGEGKVHPGKGDEGPEEEWGYSGTLSLTSALYVVGWLTPHPGRFTLRNNPVPIV